MNRRPRVPRKHRKASLKLPGDDDEISIMISAIGEKALAALERLGTPTEKSRSDEGPGDRELLEVTLTGWTAQLLTIRQAEITDKTSNGEAVPPPVEPVVKFTVQTDAYPLGIAWLMLGKFCVAKYRLK